MEGKSVTLGWPYDTEYMIEEVTDPGYIIAIPRVLAVYL